MKLKEQWPHASALSGPLNPFKLTLPFLAAFYWAKREQLPKKSRKLVWACAAIGSLFALVASAKCGFDLGVVREWFVFLSAMLGAACLFLLPPRLALGVTMFWLAVLAAFPLVEVLSHDSHLWLMDNLFDPAQKSALTISLHITGPLMGIWDQGSLGKLAAVAPWVLGLFWARLYPRPRDGRAHVVFLSLAFFSALLVTIASFRRGPLVGLLLGGIAFYLHLTRGKISWRALVAAAGIVALAVGVSLALLPRDLMISRLRSTVGMDDHTRYGQWSAHTRDERYKIMEISLREIREHPLGNACVPASEFKELGRVETSSVHSHNLILQQFRDKGWIWGTVHLSLWMIALCGAWLTFGLEGAFALGGIVTVLGLGLVDHPWFVLNQAILLWALLWAGIAGAVGRKSG